MGHQVVVAGVLVEVVALAVEVAVEEEAALAPVEVATFLSAWPLVLPSSLQVALSLI